MTKAYVIIMGWGAYSDRGTKPVRVYLDRQRAEDAMTILEAIAAKYSYWNREKQYEDYALADRNAPLAKAEYEAIGFDASVHDDWELAEAEMDDAALSRS